MKQSLQLRMGQHLAMTPQLQQAIKLLQLSSMDLQHEIQEALDSNMMLEMAEEEPAGSHPAEMAGEPTPAVDLQYREIPDLDAPADIPGELPVDVSWDELYEAAPAGPSSASSHNTGEDYPFQQTSGQSLHDLLTWQMELAKFSDRDYAIATALIDSINEDGYLGAPLEEIHQALEQQIPLLDLEEVRAVLHRIQSFEPSGIGAVDLADCLRIQLMQLPDPQPHRQSALRLVGEHLDLLARRDVAGLKRRLDLADDDLAATISLIRRLEPKPGRQVSAESSQYITPDVYVVRQGQHWTVRLNPDISPHLRVNPVYSGMVKRADNSSDNATMRHHLQEARWFIKSLQSRNETLLKVARSIIERQQAFLDEGEKAMRPLVLRDIAEELGMHESTISRVTTQKYMHTPNGIFEFKYFFSSHVSTQGGGECSATAIKAYLKEIVDQEDTSKPLSDEAIAKQLQERGINIARRTIAKYREAMGIPPSVERKQIF
ncbi:MAG: RNA polymerase factor sigma-54 [Methylococcus sp.]